MTVKELIGLLQKCDPNKQVVVVDHYRQDTYELYDDCVNDSDEVEIG